MRREVARLALERLITDGRIHPGRIEEVVNKVAKELDEQIVELGEEACLDVGIHDLKPEMIKLLGTAPLPDELRTEHAPALQGGRVPLRAHGRRARSST